MTGDDRPVKKLKVSSTMTPAGDQPEAIRKATDALRSSDTAKVTLLGATGTGKTFTTAKILEEMQQPALVLAPNKTLAAQLAEELRQLMPDNAVEYFVSYYDFYQPEAYVASSDTFIEKEATINSEIDRLRHSATLSLLTRRDVIVVASVSCIYGLGSPESYLEHLLLLKCGEDAGLERTMRRLVALRYGRNDLELRRGTFRVRGDTLEVHPAGEDHILRVEFHGDTLERITHIEPTSGTRLRQVSEAAVPPASHYVTGADRLKRAARTIGAELAARLETLEKEGKALEARRLRTRTERDLEMLQETGWCNGIENYSAHLEGRAPGTAPYTLLDYFPEGFITVIDESHVTIPQMRAMHEGDRARKTNLIEHGFRLPSAADNRPLRFDEIEERLGRQLYLSATPGPYERSVSDVTVEQVIRPTGIVDPSVHVRPTEGQIDDLLEEIRACSERDQRTLVTTLTKRMAEDLTSYLEENGVKVRYLHSDVETLDRIETLAALRRGDFDVLVGINLLREGLDLPEVALVAILDADKEGFLRSETSLVQTIGRAGRNTEGRVIMYADNMTGSMRRAIEETERRRTIQEAHNRKHGKTPQNARRATGEAKQHREDGPAHVRDGEAGTEDLPDLIGRLERQMKDAAAALRFEQAAKLRDEVKDLRRMLEADL